jgi:hypothetical protein
MRYDLIHCFISYARGWRLLATAHDVPDPRYGITSLLDFAPDQVPANMSETALTSPTPPSALPSD